MLKNQTKRKHRWNPVRLHRRLQHLGILPGEVHQFALYSLTRAGREIRHDVETDLQSGEVRCSCEHFLYKLAASRPHLCDATLHCKHITRALDWLHRHGLLKTSLAELRPCRKCGVVEAEFEMCDGSGHPLPGHFICRDCIEAATDDLRDASPILAPQREPVPAFPDADGELTDAPRYTRHSQPPASQAALTAATTVPAHIDPQTGELRPGYLPSGDVDYNGMFED